MVGNLSTEKHSSPNQSLAEQTLGQETVINRNVEAAGLLVKDKNGGSQFYLEALLSTSGCRLYFSETLKKSLGANAEVPL